MQNHIRFIALGLAGASVIACAPARAQTQTLKFGAIRYEPHSRTDGITGIGLPPGADADVGAANTALLTYEIEVKPKVGIELVLGYPPKIKAKATGSVAFLGDVLTARNVAPTLFANYHFGEPGAALRPYLGIGVNYTHFADISSPYGWDVKLSDSYGLAAIVGVDWAIDKQWGLFGSLARVQVKSHLVAVGAVVLQSDIDFRPVTYSFGAFVKF